MKSASETHSDISSLPEWDLSDLYSSINDPSIEKELSQAKELSCTFAKQYEGTIQSISGNELLQAIQAYETMEDLLGKLASYAQLVYAADMSKTEHTRFYQNIMEHVNDISSECLFFTLEINLLEDNALETLYSKCPELAHYKPWLRDIRAYKPYQLSQKEEAILHEKSLTGRQSWNRLFDETIAGLRFPLNEKKLTCAEITHLLSSHEATERKAAAKSLGGVLGDNAKTFALITNVLAKDKAIEDKLRGFKQPISSRNVSNFVEDEVVDALLAAVKERYQDISHRYYAIKAKWLGSDTMPYWDRNAPLPDSDSKDITWQEAKETVLASYHAFCPEIAAIGQKFFDQNWIDVPPREGKDSGAFAHPTVPSAHPYLLLNYQHKLRDVMTLAHELGHGIHQVLSASKGALMADTPLTLAETASVFGEQLTFRALLDKESDPKQRNIMIANKVEDMINTVIRQVAFCEFERLVHNARQKGEVPLETICEFWMQVQSESLGKAITFEEEYKYYWAYIPHFIHSPFYVYSYAFGDCLVNALYQVYLEKPDGFVDKYTNLLKAGGTLWHKELLAPFGLDASDPAFWQKGLDVISGFIDELET